MHTMPKEIEFVADKILKNKSLYDEIKKLLISSIRSLHNDSMAHASFCDTLKTPKDLDKKLLKIFGINDRQMLDAFTYIGFHPDSRMYSSLYYQSLCLVYYIGVRSDDDLLRILSTSLIYIKIFNGRKYKYMPNGCQEDIAQYIIQNNFRGSHTFKKYPSPFRAITEYFAPTLDSKYYDYCKKDPAHPTKGLVVILMQSWARMDQSFMGIQKHYYKAHYDGNKNMISSSSTTSVGGREIDELSINKISNTVNKLQQNMLMKKLNLTDNDIKFLKSDPYNIGNKFLKDSSEFLDDPENDDDLKNIYELILQIIKVDESELCGLHVVSTVSKITSAKGNNTQVMKLKTYVDSLLGMMYKGIMRTAPNSSKLKLRKVLLLIILLRGKKAFCNKAEFEKDNF